ncbi:MAG: prolyl oligopeptidase family serine peptidase [Candidatus Acetothermia bacterium]
MKNKLQLTDLADFCSVGNVALSPDGSRVAFDHTIIDPEENQYETDLSLYNKKTDRIHRLTGGGNSFNPIWRDEKRILFLSQDAEGCKTAIRSLNLKMGGSINSVAEVDCGISYLQVGSKGKALFLGRPSGGPDDQVHRIDRLPFWRNGVGFTYHRPVQAYMVDLRTGRTERLTDHKRDVYSAAISPDGDRLAYLVSAQEDNPLKSDLFIAEMSDESTSRINTGLVMDPGTALTWNPEGTKLALQGHRFERGYATHNDILLVSVDEGGEITTLTEGLSTPPGNHLYCDVLSPPSRSIPQELVWVDGTIYFLLSEGGTVCLAGVDVADGRVERFTGEGSVYHYSIAEDVAVYTRTSDTEPVELWESELTGQAKANRITDFNVHLKGSPGFAESEHLRYSVSDGEEVEGWLMKPGDLTEGASHPLIVWIHGGPKSMLGRAFMFEFQFYAANGYAVLYMNPRGSHGYTEDFADIRGHYGERDYKDIMEVLDKVESDFAWIGGNRLGVTGLSYGGFMTNWIVAKNDRFAAAISEEGISDQFAMFGDTDIGYYFNRDAMGGDPWNNLEAYIEKSSLLKADQVTTPTMFIHAMDDYRCWADQSIEYFTALKYLGVDSELVLVPEGGHVVGWTGRPDYRLKRLECKLEWFDKYLKT